MKYYNIIILILLLILIALFYDEVNFRQKRINNEKLYIQHIKQNPGTTKYHYDYSENDIYNQHNISNMSNVIYLFWTGGFDSTYRLLELITQNKYIQPIYVMCPNLDSVIDFKRQNVNIEIKTMKKIRKKIYQYFPDKQKYLLPTRYITSIKLSPQIAQKYIHITTVQHNFSRGITQYERLTQYSYVHPYPIELGLEKCRTGMDRLTYKYRNGDVIDFNRAPSEYSIFKNLRFPIAHLTKYDMIELSKKNNTYEILKLSWSCWFPINDKPCGKCNMCKHRIIP